MLEWLKDAIDTLFEPGGSASSGTDDHPCTPMAGQENPTDSPDWHNGFGVMNDQQAAAEVDSFNSFDWSSSDDSFSGGSSFDDW